MKQNFRYFTYTEVPVLHYVADIITTDCYFENIPAEHAKIIRFHGQVMILHTFQNMYTQL